MAKAWSSGFFPPKTKVFIHHILYHHIIYLYTWHCRISIVNIIYIIIHVCTYIYVVYTYIHICMYFYLSMHVFITSLSLMMQNDEFECLESSIIVFFGCLFRLAFKAHPIFQPSSACSSWDISFGSSFGHILEIFGEYLSDLSHIRWIGTINQPTIIYQPLIMRYPINWRWIGTKDQKS